VYRSVFLLIGLLSLSAASARSQVLPMVGSEATFEVATWNIEWFGSSSNGPSDDAQQFENVRKVIAETGIDVWALQEISDTRLFDDLLDALGTNFAGALATNSGQQRIAFIYDTRVIRLRSQISHILEDFGADFASRPPIQMDARVTIDGTTVDFTLITVHMKAFADFGSYEKRLAASTRIKNRIDFTLLSGEPVIVLGDLNDEIRRSITSGRESPYANFRDDAQDYFFATLELEDRNAATFCGSSPDCATGSTIDHILLTNEAAALYEEGSADRMENLLSDLPQYLARTSDHLPVYALFDLGLGTDVDDPAEIPGGLTLTNIFPLPSNSFTTVEISTTRPTDVTIEISDLLGRVVLSHVDARSTIGSRTVTLDTSGLSSGVYHLRVMAGQASAGRLLPVVH